MYSKNDYRYYLEHRLEESDDYLAHYGVKGMKWKKRKGRDLLNILDGTRKRSLELVKEDNNRGVKATDRARNDYYNRRLRGFSESRTKTAPNMYTTRNKGKYSKSETGHTMTLSSGGSTTVKRTYGQADKRADMRADKKMRKAYINQQNPHSYDKSKSLRKNIEDNRKVSRRRKVLKERAYRKVDEQYRNA